MKTNSYLLYKEYLKKRDLKNKTILIAKTKNSYLIGPLINIDFNEESFYKRIISNSIYKKNIYKNISSKKCLELITKYQNNLANNEVIEIMKDGSTIIHKIIKVPGDEDE